MKNGRIVVRIEIATLMTENGKLSHKKLDRLAMVLSNLQNSGKELLVVTSGAIVLGMDKICVKAEDIDVTTMMAAAAIGQAELIKHYQRYFDQYNQMVAQVLLTSDIMKNEKWKQNAQNTFETLLSMNIIPIINENDAVSTSDIELDDNYPLALKVADVCKADIIVIKSDNNGNYIIQPRNSLPAIEVKDDREMMIELGKNCLLLDKYPNEEYIFPQQLSDIKIANR